MSKVDFIYCTYRQEKAVKQDLDRHNMQNHQVVAIQHNTVGKCMIVTKQ
jgi:hypothetical protein